MIIDAHAHIFPDRIAQKAADATGAFYDLRMRYDGTLKSLLEEGERAGVSRFVVFSAATTAPQVKSINNFIAKSVKSQPEKLIGFGTLHPDYEDIEGETERIVSLGLKGIKLHPDFQNFYIDDENAMPIYEAAVKSDLPVLFHVGDTRYDYSSPERLMNVVKRFPDLKVIGAHFAGWSMWDRGAEIFKNSGIYTDLSSSLYAMTAEHAAELIHKIGADRVMFGTDYPMWSADEELELFSKIPLTDDERENILYKNACRLLNLN